MMSPEWLSALARYNRWMNDKLYDLAATLVVMRRGRKLSSPLRWAVAHLFNHQTHHRGQITTLLKQQGCNPGVTDLFAMLRDE